MCTVRGLYTIPANVLIDCRSCLQDIVGALYHCAACEARGESVDICSNCEAAGLPGNLDAPDGGHSSSHIMIKACRTFFLLTPIFTTFQIPVPMNPNEIQAAGRRALQLWCERDAPKTQRVNPISRRNSLLSADVMTVIDSKSSHSVRSPSFTSDEPKDHNIPCKGCGKVCASSRFE